MLSAWPNASGKYEKYSDYMYKGSHDLMPAVRAFWGTTEGIMMRDTDIFRAENMMTRLNVWISKVWKHCKTSILNNLF